MAAARMFGLGVIDYSNLYTHRDALRKIEIFFAEINDGHQDDKLSEIIARHGELALFVRFSQSSQSSAQRMVERLRQKMAHVPHYYAAGPEQGLAVIVGDLRLFLAHAVEGQFPDLFDAKPDSGAPGVIETRFLPILDKINELTQALRKVSE